MEQEKLYPIGEQGKPWGASEKSTWLAQQSFHRSYQHDIVSIIEQLQQDYNVENYGELNYGVGDYSLFALASTAWDETKKNVLITGGVHGYETSGVMGALRFLQLNNERYNQLFNFFVAPCISPWGYETINRWNPNTVDPNRSFYNKSPAQESARLMSYLAESELTFDLHIDLHETTNSDNGEFRPALAARDAIPQKSWNIPDGFYLVGDTEKPCDKFQKRIIEEVKKVTHIAPADSDGQLIGVPLEQNGVINYSAQKLGLCMGLTSAPYVTTTEVYPDSELVDDENCIQAQVAAVNGALEYLIDKLQLK